MQEVATRTILASANFSRGILTPTYTHGRIHVRKSVACSAMFSFRAKSTAGFRSAGRDRETDNRRLAPVRSSVKRALEDAQREKSALGKRLEEAQTRATILAGTDTYEHDARAPEKTIRLAESEADMKRAEDRLLELERQISQLQRIEQTILEDWNVPPASGATAPR